MVRKGKSVVKNVVYQTFYNVLATITPLITIPIVSREMGADNLGVFSYSLTLSHYFAVFAMLGIVNYGTRAIAETNNSIINISKTFWSIYSFQLFMAFFSSFIYLLCLFTYRPNNLNIFAIQTFWILSALVNINWLFFGLEDFRITVTRSIIIKIITVISIVLFVNKNNNPLQTYTLIMAGGDFLSNIMIFPLIKNRVVWYKPSFNEVKQHIYPIFILFLPILATLLFGSIDKVMLGRLSNFEELGYYYNADRVIFIPMGIVGGLSTVLFPRVSSLVAADKKEESLLFINKTFEVNIWIGILLSVGIAGCAKEFVPLFFGQGFEKCIELIYLMTPILIIGVICTFYRMQYLIPFHYDSLYAFALISGTIINILLNYFLIPDYKSVGAAFATLIAHIAVMIIQFKEHNGIILKRWFVQFSKYIFIGVIMFICMRLVSNYSESMLINVILELFFGGCVYLLVSVCYWVLTKQFKDKMALIKV